MPAEYFVFSSPYTQAMKSRTEIAHAHMGEDHARWSATCRGEYCAACGDRLDDGLTTSRFRLCQACWVDPTQPFHAVYAFIMGRANEAWTLCFCDADRQNGPLSLWSVRETSEECLAVVSRWLSRSGVNMAEHIETFGHAGTIIFLGERQYRAMVNAGIRDPRNGAEKRKALEERAR